jgi:hypothetical protein
VTYPSGGDPYQQGAPAPSSGQQYPPQYPPQPEWGAQQGYPPQPSYPSQGQYPPQPGYPQQGQYAPQSGYPAQGQYPPQPGYPPQAGYPPQPPYGYPPQPGAQYAPYGMPQPGQPPAAPAKARNPMARTALWYGIASLAINIVGLFIGFYLTGILAVFGIYYGIRAVSRASRLPGNAGIGLAVTGIVLCVLSLGISILGYAGHF